MGVELPPHGRMNAVAAHQNVAGDGDARAFGALPEAGFDGAFLLRKGTEDVAGAQCSPPQALPHRIAQNALQMTAMDRKLWHLIASLQSTRLAPYFLTEAVGIDQFARPDRHLVEPGQQSKLGQLGNGMRQNIDADAKLTNSG